MHPDTQTHSGCPFHHPNSMAPLSPHELEQRAMAFDPFQHAYMANPSETVRWAREQRPVFYSPQLDYWVVTRHATVKAVFRDPITFSPSNVLEPLQAPDPEIANILRQYDYRMNRTLVNEDEPTHQARRRVLMAPFTPEHLKAHEPMVRQLVTDAIDRFIDDGEVDLVKQLFWHVPFTVALHFLGIDDDADRETMHQFAIAHTINAFGRPTREQRHTIAHTVGKFWQFSGEVLNKMRRTPDGPGWMRYSIRQQQHYPEIVTDSYLHSMMMAIIVAAHETTTFATTNALKTLLGQQTVWDEICRNPELLSPAMEECLRHDGSIGSWRRRTTREVELDGVTIPKGAGLLLVVHSANHDADVFPDPDSLDIRRDNAVEHLTFGFGAHQCLGKNLGRLEMQVMIGELARRLPHMKLAEQDYQYVPNLSFRGPQQLKVIWDPAANPERCLTTLPKLPEVRVGAPLAKDLARRLQVTEASRLNDDILLLTLQAADDRALPQWTPGAHIDIECGDSGLSRQYSLCSDPADGSRWQVAVLREPASRGGSAWLHRQVQVGTRLRVRGPRNRFALQTPSSTNEPLIFIAGGIGITPIMTMAALARQQRRPYELHYCASSRRRMPFIDTLTARHGDRLRLHISDEGTRCEIDALFANASPATQVYACGPERLLAALSPAMQARGLPEDALHVERFHGNAAGQLPADAREFEVELTISGLVLKVASDQTLLQVLRANNLDIPSDCEEGLCGACEIPVVDGQVAHHDVVLSAAERRSHQRMMSCCSRAQGSRLKLPI